MNQTPQRLPTRRKLYRNATVKVSSASQLFSVTTTAERNAAYPRGLTRIIAGPSIWVPLILIC